MLLKKAILLCHGILILLLSCKHNDEETYKTDNQLFISMVSRNLKFKEDAGKLLAGSGYDERLKSYAADMLLKQAALRSALQSLAAKKNWIVPDETGKDDRTRLDFLRSLQPEVLEKEFPEIMVLAHQKDNEIFVNATVPGGVRDSDLRNFAEQQLPGLRDALQEAQDLQRRMENDPGHR
jgi:predicted outer membrane protein